MRIENGEYRVKSSQGGSLGGKGRMGTCVGMAKSLRRPPETVTLLISYTPISNKKFKKKWLKKKKKPR